MWMAGSFPRHSAVTRDVKCAGCRGAAFCASCIVWTTITALEQLWHYGAREDRAKGAVTIDNSASAALLWQRATCRTTWKSRSGRSKHTRCSNPASRLGAATDAEITVAPY